MSILDYYKKQRSQLGFAEDTAQQKTVEQLAVLQQQLTRHLETQQTFAYKIKSTLLGSQPSLKGCYIWGDVGRGKTWLMDMFFESFDHHSPMNKKKVRMHFHHFMAFIHDQLRLIDEQKAPLKYIAKSFSQRYQLLCLDEFHVSDITDAMLLHGLLESLLAEGLIMVITSNQPPDELYKNGLQRDRFLPAIELLQQHNHIIQLNGDVDHRLRRLQKADTWYLPFENNDQLLKSRFLDLTAGQAKPEYNLHINYRTIKTLYHSSHVVWFEFNIICGNHRGSADYIEIASQYHTVFISHIPEMDDAQNDKAKRFINMIDEFYDRNVILVCSAETEPGKIYSGSQLKFEFRRTISRLEEMRSYEYMQKAHKMR